MMQYGLAMARMEKGLDIKNKIRDIYGEWGNKANLIVIAHGPMDIYLGTLSEYKGYSTN